MIKEAIKAKELGMAVLMAVARLFFLRVPSEGLPLQWDGTHSSIKLEGSMATLTLIRRKTPEHRPPCVVSAAAPRQGVLCALSTGCTR